MQLPNVKILLHHCPGGQWFYFLRNFNCSGIWGFRNENDECSIPGADPECFRCTVCDKTTARMEEEHADAISSICAGEL